jgi:crotonobetainyl-CoA:carnitine CoA-transferase CaiB-like acyl-CoA transferase
MNAIAFADTPADIRTAAPKLGEHTAHVLRELLGMSADEYASLEQKGVLS